MADLIKTTLRRLLPPGRASNYSGQAANVVDALAVSLDRPKEFLRAVQDEASPRTAVATIDQWLDMLNIVPPIGATLTDKQGLAYAAWTAVGGQSLDYLNDKLRKAYPNAFIQEGGTELSERIGEAEIGELECETITTSQLFYYIVAGWVNFARDRLSIQALIRRIVPLHLVEIFIARVKFDGDIARCNIATCGRSICGRTISTYVETAAEIGRCAIGRCGVAVVGRTA